jgi:hypothetical protein
MSRLAKFLRFILIAISIAAIGFGFTFGSRSYIMSRLNAARSFGVFPSPSEGMLTLIRSDYVGIQEARVVHAVQETALGGGPHVWFVSACVWADSRADGSSLVSEWKGLNYPGNPFADPDWHNFDFPGSYFVDTQEGWVLMPETSLPLFVGFGMSVFGLAGDDRAEPIDDPSRIPATRLTPVCVRQTE